MKKILCLIALLMALPLTAQVATLTTPETQATGTKSVVTAVHIDAVNSTAQITVALQDAGGTVSVRGYSYTAQNAEYTSFMTALGSARATETGSVPRRLQFRVIGWMSDNSKLFNSARTPVAVTVAP